MVSTLTAAVKEVTFKIEGKLPGSARRYSLLSLFNPFKALGRLVSTFSSLVVKLVLFIIILAIGPFAYLFISMENEGTIQKAIDQSEAYIQKERQNIVSLEEERAPIAKQIEALRLREDKLNRQEKIDIMELSVKVHALDQKRQAIEVEIASHEHKIAKNLEKIEEVKKKSFLQRLLRR
jgi:biopolymer transport protein ExbB/TolQ